MSERPQINPNKSPERIAEQFKSITERSGRLALKAMELAEATNTKLYKDEGPFREYEVSEGGATVHEDDQYSDRIKQTSVVPGQVGVWSRGSGSESSTGLSKDSTKVEVREYTANGRASTERVSDATDEDVMIAVDKVKKVNDYRRNQSTYTKSRTELKDAA